MLCSNPVISQMKVIWLAGRLKDTIFQLEISFMKAYFLFLKLNGRFFFSSSVRAVVSSAFLIAFFKTHGQNVQPLNGGNSVNNI